MSVATYDEISRTGAVDTKGVRTYTRKYIVTMTSFTNAPPNTWGGIPVNRYDPYPLDSGAVAVSLSSEPVGENTQGVYHVTYQYTSQPFDKGNASGDPAQSDNSTVATSRPWTIKFGSTHGTRLLTKDASSGVGVVNSLGIPFDPTVEIPTSNLTIQVTAFKDFSTFDPISKQLFYQDNINDADLLLAVSPSTITVFPAKTLRCTEYGASSTVDNGQVFWQIDLNLEYKRDGWNPIKLLNCGMVYKKSSGVPPQPILDKQGNPINSPVPLDASGNVLNAGDALVYLDFDGYIERNFATILT